MSDEGPSEYRWARQVSALLLIAVVVVIVVLDVTPEAERHGAVLALSEVVLVARPEGLEPPTL